jgi:Kelch motif
MAGFWQALTNQPTFNASTALLLTNGTVMCQSSGTKKWWKLTPDITGSYVNGSWSPLADSPNGPLYYASAVLRDGRVIVAGGEYEETQGQVWLNAAEIYNPVSNTWVSISTPAGFTQIGDAASCLLPDGRFMIGAPNSSNIAIYDPINNAWTAAAPKTSNEETWVLLPDETVLTVDCIGHPLTQKYLIAADSWVSAGNAPVELVKGSDIEIGPGMLLPDGRCLFVGASGATAVYSPPNVASQPGTWTVGPSFPLSGGVQLVAEDAPGCLLPNGKVLLVVGPTSPAFSGPSSFFEFDPSTNTLAAVLNPPNAGDPAFVGRMLLLPTGQVLFTNGSTDAEVYTPDSAPDPAWKPQITSHPYTVRPGFTYTLRGRQINGLSQACIYGDDAMTATNYPIVTICNNFTGHIFYCRTHDHSTMGLQTGTIIHSTRFTVASGIETGPSTLCVIANGITSDCVSIGVSHKRWKELKWEIKETFKAEIDLISRKRVFEDKSKDAEIDELKRLVEDPEWLRSVRLLAERSDKIEGIIRKESFITKDERPDLGEEALAISAAEEEEESEQKQSKTPRSRARPGTSINTSTGQQEERRRGEQSKTPRSRSSTR